MKKTVSIKYWALACATPLLALNVWATDYEFQPSVSVSYLNILEAGKYDANDLSLFNLGGSSDTERFASLNSTESGDSALTLTPGITMSVKGPVWNANWTIEHTSNRFQKETSGNSSYNKINLANQFTLLQKRLSLFTNVSRQKRNVDSRLSGFTDPVFYQGEYIAVDTYNAGLSFQNVVSNNWRNKINYTISTTDFDENELKETDATSTNLYQNDRQQFSINTQYGGRPNQLRSEMNLSVSAVDRKQSGNQNTGSLAINIGVPIWSSLDFVLTGNKTVYEIESQSEDIVLPDFDNESYGMGLAWRFSGRSYIEVTQNRDTRGQTLFGEEQVNQDFLGARLVLIPSNRTSLTYEKNQRFYGDAHSAAIQYSGSRWNFNLTYREDLNTNNRIVRDVFSIGPHLCPTLDSDSEECEALEEIPTERPDEGFLLELFDQEFSIKEELVLTKGGNASFSYRTKKSQLSLSYSQNQRQFLEREGDYQDNNQLNKNWSLNYDYKMSRRTSFKFSYSRSKVDYEALSDADDGSGTGSTAGDTNNDVAANDIDDIQQNQSISISLDRKLTRKATGTLSIIQTESEGRRYINRPNDTRLSLTYKYSF